MKPAYKHSEIDRAITDITGIDRKKTITNNKCVFCDATDITEQSFRDSVSVKEYTISGMCQQCQDDFFGI